MLSADLEKVDEASLHGLIMDEVRESDRIEYKRELPLGRDSDKVPFLSQVCSFANAAGGDLVIGIEAKDGIPINIPGVEVGAFDALLLRLDSWIREGLEPRFAGFTIRQIPMSGNGDVIVVRVQKSWNRPHRVKANSVFYGRTSAGREQLDLSHVRRLFLLSDEESGQLRSLRAERLLALSMNSTPVSFVNGPKVVLQLVPIGALRSDEVLSTKQLIAAFPSIRPLQAGDLSKRIDIDGISFYSGDSANALSYVQIHRTGLIEAVDGEMLSDNKLYASDFEPKIAGGLRRYLDFLAEHSIDLPLFVCLSLLGLKEATLGISHNFPYLRHSIRPIRQSNVSLPEVMIENYNVDVCEALKPIFDRLWNAFGIDRSYSYDALGRWTAGPLP